DLARDVAALHAQLENATDGADTATLVADLAAWDAAAAEARRVELDDRHAALEQEADDLRLTITRARDDLAARGELKPAGELAAEKRAYFPPCHLRAQGMGEPWRELLDETAAAGLQTVSEPTDCCGLGGVMGFKKNFHWASLAMG
ncbi:hypothetical protein J8J27_22380, partial [Mycobacterium tuberculosis]|nr:hypothetical protein [Mycobacterium tuberculosis]